MLFQQFWINFCIIALPRNWFVALIPFQFRELHNQGYSLRTRDSSGQIPLHYAARYGRKDIVKYIINNAPNVINDKDINLWVFNLTWYTEMQSEILAFTLINFGVKVNDTAVLKMSQRWGRYGVFYNFKMFT